MKERPMLFSAPMVQAILAGRKTQTRRIKSHINPGDLIWVKETFSPHPEFPNEIIYRADRGGDYQGQAQGDFKWKPSIFMPRKSSRISLVATAIRNERLWDISENDAMNEGVVLKPEPYCMVGGGSPYVAEYSDLWEKINGKGSWGSNPIVKVIEFRRIK